MFQFMLESLKNEGRMYEKNCIFRFRWNVVFVNLKLCHFQWKFQLKIVPVFYYAPSVMVTQKEVERR